MRKLSISYLQLSKKLDQEVFFKVEHCGEVLGQSEAILPTVEQMDINFEVTLYLNPTVPSSVDNAISNPVICESYRQRLTLF